MSRTKLLIFAVAVLLLLNLGTLGFLFFTGLSAHDERENLHGMRKMPREIIIERLHFDRNQVTDYDVLIKDHQKKIRAIEDKISGAKNSLYLKLNDETASSRVTDSLIETLASCQKQIETIHFKHFEAIKKLCKKSQRKDFELLSQELSQIFSKPPPRKND